MSRITVACPGPGVPRAACRSGKIALLPFSRLEHDMEWVRNNRRWAQIVLILIIIPVACTGIASLRNMQSGDADTVAKVGRVTITRGEVDRAMREQIARLRQMMGDRGNFDASMFDTPKARSNVLDQLIDQRAMEQESERVRIAIGDEQLKSIIGREPLFQMNNQFYKEYYEDFAKSRGQTPAQLDRALRNDYSTQQLALLPAASTIVSTTALTQVAALYGQVRLVATSTIEPGSFMSQVKVDDDQIRAYYDANQARFQTPQTIDVQYVVLSAGELGAARPISDSDLQQYYDQNRSRFYTPEQRRASHILIAVDAAATPEQKAAAKAKAEKVLAEVRAHPADFAKLAQQYSDDSGTKDRGGDLDFTPKGGWVKPFEDAAFSMHKGEISDLVQSDFGYHIIELTDVRPAVAKSLAEVRPEIESEIRSQLGNRALSEQAEAFSNMVYEQPDSLQPAIDRFGLKPQTARGLVRGGASTEPMLGPKVIAALFGDDALRDRRNTAAIEVQPGTFVSARVTDVHPAQTRPFEEVRDAIRRVVSQQQAAKLAEEAGQLALEALKKGEPPAIPVGFSQPVRVSLQDSAGVAPQLLRDLFRIGPKQALPVYVGTSLDGRGYQIARVDAVADADSASTNGAAATMAEQVRRTIGDAETNAFVAAVRARTKVTINEKAETPAE